MVSSNTLLLPKWQECQVIWRNPFHDNIHVYNYSFVLIYIYWSQGIDFVTLVQINLYISFVAKYIEQRISPIFHIDLVRHGHGVLQSYFIKSPKDISHVYEEGQIPSRTLMSKTASVRFYRSSKNRVSFRQGVMNLINF